MEPLPSAVPPEKSACMLFEVPSTDMIDAEALCSCQLALLKSACQGCEDGNMAQEPSGLRRMVEVWVGVGDGDGGDGDGCSE